MARPSPEEANATSKPESYRQDLGQQQKLRSKRNQVQTAAEISRPALPRKAKMKKSGRPHRFIRGDWQGG
jgi:hypothetical protein